MTIFVAALLLFMSFFNQTLQTAVLYEQHKTLATNCSDLLDNLLLNPGNPLDWGQKDSTPSGFGVQDPEFTSYSLSPFALMRLQPLFGTPVSYSKTGKTYSNMTMGLGNSLLMPKTEEINYSIASKLLGISTTQGFQLALTPTITVTVSELQAGNPLLLTVNVYGIGSILSNATLSYCFLKVVPGQGNSPAYTTTFGSSSTDGKGSATLQIQGVASTDSYAIIIYASTCGLTGVGYYERVGTVSQCVVPLVNSVENRQVLLANSYDLTNLGPPQSVFYNATFVLLDQDFTFRAMPIQNSTGQVNYGVGNPFATITIPTSTPGILIITYQSNSKYGVVTMPWGIGSMAFPLTFGGNPFGKDWVATDTRQVMVNGIAYQAKLSLWSLQGYQGYQVAS